MPLLRNPVGVTNRRFVRAWVTNQRFVTQRVAKHGKGWHGKAWGNLYGVEHRFVSAAYQKFVSVATPYYVKTYVDPLPLLRNPYGVTMLRLPSVAKMPKPCVLANLAIPLGYKSKICMAWLHA